MISYIFESFSETLKYLEALPYHLGTIIVIGCFILFSISGLLIVRRIVSHHFLKEQHDVAGFVFANLGVLYSVLLGFTVLNVQQRFDKMNEQVEYEASYLSQLYRDAAVFKIQDKTNIRTSIKQYIHSVINNEWQAMSEGKISEVTIKALRQLWDSYYVAEIITKQQEAWYYESINKLNLMMQSRLSRLLGANELLQPEMWFLLIAGGFIMVCFMWFFGVENLISHLLMTTIFATVVAFLLFLIYSLDTAFTGLMSVPPTSLEKVLKGFHEAD